MGRLPGYNLRPGTAQGSAIEDGIRGRPDLHWLGDVASSRKGREPMTAAAKTPVGADEVVLRRGQRSEVGDPRRIINRRQVARDLADLAEKAELTPAELKKRLLDRLKLALGEGRAERSRP